MEEEPNLSPIPTYHGTVDYLLRVQSRADFSERASTDHLEVAEAWSKMKVVLHCRGGGGWVSGTIHHRTVVVVVVVDDVVAHGEVVELGRRGTGASSPAHTMAVIHLVACTRKSATGV